NGKEGVDGSSPSEGFGQSACKSALGCCPFIEHLFHAVDGFTVLDGVYTGNEEYAIFPICSRNGLIEGNDVEGTDDAAIYIGNSHDVIVEHNHATDSTVGIEIENSTGIVRGNTAIGNTSGIVTFVLPGLAVPVEDVPRAVEFRGGGPGVMVRR
ncbi:MAG: NosD domain-containing protein, partial [Gaiellales bacterium]